MNSVGNGNRPGKRDFKKDVALLLHNVPNAPPMPTARNAATLMIYRL